MIVHCLLLCHLSEHPSFSGPVVVSTFLDYTHPVLEEDIPEVVCQSRDSCDIPFLLDISLSCNAVVENPCLVPDGFEIAGGELILVVRG